MNSGVPIKPSEIPAAKAVVIPPFVFNCFNKCIAFHIGRSFKDGRRRMCQTSCYIEHQMVGR